MARFFINENQITGEDAYIEGSDVKHITRVLRMGPGDGLVLVDEKGCEYDSQIETVEPGRVMCHISAKHVINREPPLELVLCQGLPKGDKMELIIQKAVELGVTKIIPVTCERSVVHLNGDKAGKKVDRWQRVAAEAAKQCRRNKIPEVAPLADLPATLKLLPQNCFGIIPWEEEATQGLKETLTRYNKNGQIWIYIGPEGGFSDREIDQAKEFGIQPVSLGPRILRTETAGLAVISMVLYECGDLGGVRG